MSTKNKNIHTYDLDSVFAEYMTTLSGSREETIANFNETIESLKKEIEVEQATLSELSPLLRKKKDPNYAENLEAATTLKTEIAAKKAELKEAQSGLKSISGELKPDLESFTQFLQDNGLSTVHAEELLNYYNNLGKFEEIAYEDFKMRKMHPKRDYVIKKVAIPTAITCTSIGLAAGIIAGSGLVGGSTVLGFIPVSGTPGLTTMATSMTGAVAGLAATPIVIKSKNLITRTYYRLRSKSAAANLEEYTNGTSIENLNISKLIAKAEKTNRSILDAKGLIKHTLNTVNRNRIHQISAYTKELVSIYRDIEQDETLDNKLKAEKLKPIYELLVEVQEFISNNIAEAKTHAMLTCKSKKKDAHPSYMIENVDIYASLKIYLDRMAQIAQDHSNEKSQMKDAKKTNKNLGQKKAEAYKIVNGERMITKMLSFENRYGRYLPKEEAPAKAVPTKEIPAKKETPVAKQEKEAPKTTNNFVPAPEVKVLNQILLENEKSVVLQLENGKEIKIPADCGVDILSKAIATAKESKNKYSITYEDGTKQEIIKKGKTIPELKTARIALLNKLNNDPEFIKEIKDAGFQTQTINKLTEKIEEWVANTDQKFTLSGRYKDLYKYAIEKIEIEKDPEIISVTEFPMAEEEISSTFEFAD